MKKKKNKIYELVNKIKKIPNVVDVNVKKGPRHFHRTMDENIGLSDWLTTVITQFRNASVIKIEEVINNNNSQINISAGDNPIININKDNITILDGHNRLTHPLPKDIIDKLESLEKA